MSLALEVSPSIASHLQSRMDNLQNMISKLISAVAHKSEEINLMYKNASGKMIKLKNVHAKTTLKELYENILPKEKRLKFLRFGNRVFDPNVLVSPDGTLRTVENFLHSHD
jgi:flagellar biosynthesis chaperone FliJ